MTQNNNHAPMNGGIVAKQIKKNTSFIPPTAHMVKNDDIQKTKNPDLPNATVKSTCMAKDTNEYINDKIK